RKLSASSTPETRRVSSSRFIVAYFAGRSLWQRGDVDRSATSPRQYGDASVTVSPWPTTYAGSRRSAADPLYCTSTAARSWLVPISKVAVMDSDPSLPLWLLK